MNKEDFDRLNEIAKELNEIRLRNNLQELQLTAEDMEITYYDYHREWYQVVLLTRGEHRYKDCKVLHLEQNKQTGEYKNLNYDEYINYRK